MTYPSGVAVAELTFNNPQTFSGAVADSTAIDIVSTSPVVWAATGEPLDNFTETSYLTPGETGSLTAPIVDQAGFIDQNGAAFTMWAYKVTRRSRLGAQTKETIKYWQPLTGQTTIDFDTLPGGTPGASVSTTIPPVTSVAGLTGAVDGAALAAAIPLDSTTEANINDSASATAAALNATYAPVSGSANYAPTAMAEAGPLLVKLERNVSNAVIAVLGDSTGQGDFTTSIRWPLKFANKLAALFPAYTVIFYMWDSTTVAYDAPVTLSTGSGPQTLTIYNCSASGQTTAYSLANLVVATPVKPDLVFINHGHNESLASYQSGALALVRGVRTRYPRTPIVAISQNPQALTDPAYTVQQQIREYIGYFAAREGLGFLDATSIFANISGYSTTLMVDGTHPNDAGYELWADATVARFTPSSKGIVRVPPAPLDVIRINASQFTASGGSPVVAAATVDRPFGGWSLDPAVAASVSTLAYIPPEWESVNVQIYWTVATDPGGNTGAVVWDVYAYAMPATYPAAYGTRHDYGGVTSAVVPSSGAINLLRRDTRPAGSAYEVTERGPFALTIQRFANSGGDTLGINAVFVGVDIERVA